MGVDAIEPFNLQLLAYLNHRFEGARPGKLECSLNRGRISDHEGRLPGQLPRAMAIRATGPSRALAPFRPMAAYSCFSSYRQPHTALHDLPSFVAPGLPVGIAARARCVITQSMFDPGPLVRLAHIDGIGLGNKLVALEAGEGLALPVTRGYQCEWAVRLDRQAASPLAA